MTGHAADVVARGAPTTSSPGGPGTPARDLPGGSVRAVREGHGANCSSIGSVIDTLFATATVGAAVFAAVVAALAREPVRIVGGAGAGSSPAPGEPPAPREPPGGAP